MERTCLKFVVIGNEAPYIKGESCDRSPRVIHVPKDPRYLTPISYNTRLDLISSTNIYTYLSISNHIYVDVNINHIVEIL
jgi:hypothetical protein